MYVADTHTVVFSSDAFVRLDVFPKRRLSPFWFIPEICPWKKDWFSSTVELEAALATRDPKSAKIWTENCELFTVMML